MPIRQPIVCMLGHVDTGKTSLLDKIRGTAVQVREAGGLTQQIGASFFPLETLVAITQRIVKNFKVDVKVPGLLVVDTPGHEAFANLRTRGGSVADIAILVIDVMHGFENQTFESLEILKSRKVPFIVAANKIDRIEGWKSTENAPFLDSYKAHTRYLQEDLDNRIYNIMGTLSREGFSSERYDRVRDDKANVTLSMRFIDDEEEKESDIKVNGNRLVLSQTGIEYKKNIDDFVEEGNNALKIEPIEAFDVVELQVIYIS